MKKSIKSIGLCSVILIVTYVTSLAQITLANLKKLASDDNDFQVEFLSKNGYKFEISKTSDDKSITMYRYTKWIENNIARSVTFVKGKKFALWSTNDETKFNAQKRKLLIENYKNIKLEDASKLLPCINDPAFAGGITFSGEKDFGLPIYYHFSSGYILISVEAIINKETIYSLILLNPLLCEK